MIRLRLEPHFNSIKRVLDHFACHSCNLAIVNVSEVHHHVVGYDGVTYRSEYNIFEGFEALVGRECRKLHWYIIIDCYGMFGGRHQGKKGEQLSSWNTIFWGVCREKED